MLLFMHKYSH